MGRLLHNAAALAAARSAASKLLNTIQSETTLPAPFIMHSTLAIATHEPEPPTIPDPLQNLLDHAGNALVRLASDHDHGFVPFVTPLKFQHVLPEEGSRFDPVEWKKVFDQGDDEEATPLDDVKLRRWKLAIGYQEQDDVISKPVFVWDEEDGLMFGILSMVVWT